jgi:hypothetical protein
MVWRDVMELLIADQFTDFLPVFIRNAAPYKLVNDWDHLILDESPALQQNLAHSQDLTVGQAVVCLLHKEIPTLLPVIDKIALFTGIVGKVIPEILYISLYAAFIDPETICFLRLDQHFAIIEPIIQVDNPLYLFIHLISSHLQT